MMTDGERVAWLAAEAVGEGDHSAPDDPVLVAAMRIVDQYGWWSDPVMDADHVLEIVTLILEGRLPEYTEP